MEIELITTKKKLSKSIINQMPIRHPQDLESFVIKGILRNVRKGWIEVLLCKDHEGYFIMNPNPKRETADNFITTHAVNGFRRGIEVKDAAQWLYDFRAKQNGTPQIYI